MALTTEQIRATYPLPVYSYKVEIEETGKSVYRVSVDGNEFIVDGKKTGRTNYSLIVDNRSFEIEVDNTDDEYRVLVDGRSYHINLVDERRIRHPAIAAITAFARNELFH